jgi:hypothetical protein
MSIRQKVKRPLSLQTKPFPDIVNSLIQRECSGAESNRVERRVANWQYRRRKIKSYTILSRRNTKQVQQISPFSREGGFLQHAGDSQDEIITIKKSAESDASDLQRKHRKSIITVKCSS